MELHTIGIDLGKTVFHLVGLNAAGRGRRAQEVVANSAAALHRERHVHLIGWKPAEASHFLGRACASRGMRCV